MTDHESTREIDINQEMAQSFVDYAMSVIVSRALPDVRDGLKPVQRRIIHSMNEANMGPGARHRKCATVVGDVMARFHPHGDQAIYDALVRLGQDFSLLHPLIDAQGNFGTVDDPPAQMRYCVVGGTLVRTPQGTFPIERLAEAAPDSEVDIDLKVLDRHGSPVRATKFFHSGVHPVLRLRTREGFEIGGTANHPLLCLEAFVGVPTLVWKTLAEISPGDTIVLQRTPNEEVGVATDRDLAAARLAGAFVAEGFVNDRRAGFNNTDQDFFDQVVEDYDLVVGGPRYVYRRRLPSGRTLWELDVQDLSALADSILSGIAGPSREMRIPEEVWAQSPAVKRAFLQTLFEGDGSCSRLGPRTIQVTYSTRSDRLAHDVQQMLLEFGVVARLARYESGERKLFISARRDLVLFARRVGFWGAKQEKLERLLAEVPGGRALSGDRIPHLAEFIRAEAPRGGREWLHKHNIDRKERWERYGDEILRRLGDSDAKATVAAVVEPGYFYATVASIEADGEAPVYSIRVDSDDHSFIANGFVNHNTECRLSRIAVRLLEGIDEDTVDFEPNYDGEHQQPVVLPARFPNLLVNGSQGIAVGMATNIPPHNLGEVIDACIHMLEHPDATAEDLLQFVKGPDFPTGAYVVGTEGLREALLTGRGSVKMRAVTEIEEIRKGRSAIVVTELPYQVSQDRVLEKIASLVQEKKIEGIADLRNESSARVGTRLVIELKSSAVPQVILNQLFKLTQLQESFGVNIVALVDGVPRTLNLAELVGHYLDHQMEVVERRTRFRLEKAKARAHILAGLIVAVDNIDEVVQLIRGSADTPAARAALMERFDLTEIQANAILDMPLRRLTALETDKLRIELAELEATIAELEAILADPAKRRAIIREELLDVKEQFAEPRRTRIIPDEGDLSLEDLIADEELIVTVSQSGYIKSVPAATYRTQGRGGRGVKAAEVSEDDVIAHLVHTTAHSYLLVFTNKGLVHRIRAHEIPRQSRTSRGVLAQSVLPLEPEERIEAIIDTRDYETSRYLVMVTKLGQAKKTELKEYDSRNQTLIAIKLAEGDELVAVRATNGENDLLIFTEQGQGIRFSEKDLRAMGRATQGVRGIRLREGDRVVGAASSADGSEVLLLTSNGYGKRTAMEEFPRQGRGGLGVKAIKLTRTRGRLIGARAVERDMEVFLVSSNGIGIRTKVSSISRQKRDASGVKVMDVGDAELSAFTIVQNGE